MNSRRVTFLLSMGGWALQSTRSAGRRQSPAPCQEVLAVAATRRFHGPDTMPTRAARLIPLLALSALASAGPQPAAVTPAARPFPLGDVRLLDSPFKDAMERNAAYLL